MTEEETRATAYTLSRRMRRQSYLIACAALRGNEQAANLLRARFAPIICAVNEAHHGNMDALNLADFADKDK